MSPEKEKKKVAAQFLRDWVAIAFRKGCPAIELEDIKVTDDKVCFNARKTCESLGIGIGDFKKKLVDAFCIYSYQPEAKKEDDTGRDKKKV